MMSVSSILSVVVVIIVCCSTAFSLTSDADNTTGAAVTGANNTTPTAVMGANNTAPGAIVDRNSSSITSNQSVQTTPAPTAGSPPPVIIQGSVTIQSPVPQQPQTACPPMCLPSQGCPTTCPGSCCKRRILTTLKSAVHQKNVKKCRCKEKCQDLRRSEQKCLIRCERVCKRSVQTPTPSSK